MTKKAKMILMHDVKLTRKAREIFGSSVKQAYAVMYNNDYDTEEEKVINLKKIAKDAIDTKEISIDSKMIAIKFDNEKIVRFNSTEWGAIASLTESFEEIEQNEN